MCCWDPGRVQRFGVSQAEIGWAQNREKPRHWGESEGEKGFQVIRRQGKKHSLAKRLWTLKQKICLNLLPQEAELSLLLWQFCAMSPPNRAKSSIPPGRMCYKGCDAGGGSSPPQWLPLTGTEGGLEESARRQHSRLSRLPASVALNHQQTAMFAILGGRSEGGSLLGAA